ncbi:MAG: ABC transporter permease, partial [Devosia sp.]
MTRLLKNREIWLALAIIVLVIAVTTRSSGFARPDNLASILNDTSILIILALGQMVVILTRSIDLSIAANVALSGMVIALINQADPSVPVPLLILAAPLLGLAFGAINGFLVWKLDIPAIVVTLGTLTIYRGTTFLIAGGQWVNADEMTPDFIAITRA